MLPWIIRQAKGTPDQAHPGLRPGRPPLPGATIIPNHDAISGAPHCRFCRPLARDRPATRATEVAMADHLILMAQYPRTGESQARLAPALGATGAARLQRRLTEHTVAMARRWRERREGRLVCVSCEGAIVGEFRHWLGDDLHYVPRSGGSLGARMAVASVRAFARGADRVLLVTVDCPDLDELQLDRAGFTL